MYTIFHSYFLKFTAIVCETMVVCKMHVTRFERLNIDPHEMYHDSEVWESLQKVNLRERILSLPHKLNTPVDRNGDRLSAGERQMLYLARASLQDTKVTK
jgi:ABC-type transport system involved in cytochrome bd biosynthesis fused ATPase/permease subunit